MLRVLGVEIIWKIFPEYTGLNLDIQFFVQIVHNFLEKNPYYEFKGGLYKSFQTCKFWSQCFSGSFGFAFSSPVATIAISNYAVIHARRTRSLLQL